MKRAGFTMIELIFVIVILGILSAVALPKLLGVKKQASEGVEKAFVGTLNRTVGPAKWSQSIMDSNDGSIATATYKITQADTDFPADFNATVGIDTTKCGKLADDTINPAATTKTGVTPVSYIFCRDGDSSQAPRFFYSDSSTVPGSDLNTTDLKI